MEDLNANQQIPQQVTSPDLISKIKSNKRIIIISSIVVGIFLVLTILASVITKNIKNVVTLKQNPIPTPEEIVVDQQNQSSTSGELQPAKNLLDDIRIQIEDLDTQQSRLAPPDVNFKISF